MTIPLPIPWADFHRAGHPEAFAYGQPVPCPLCLAEVIAERERVEAEDLAGETADG